ncbi:CdaR family transcriptional regulator [Streptomyces sp. JJ36]|uniref:PucR family transcriptional regulator n=1 Tax=Streptomyces sp. JJ36 TaxID=2736645 RepID=UPI001F3740F0|nr:helix-turn-helix domain-containing protein [Streptomyces sp. JJ36]MCF6524411.1 helix-turn-helix domain-containing protein [Streptomyces sp. JJ36]
MSRAPLLRPPRLSEPQRQERLRLLCAVKERVEEVADTAVAVMRAEIPSYAVQDAPFFADVRDQVLAHYRIQLALLADERRIEPEDLVFSRAAAMRRARAGFPLEDWINAFRVGRQVFWDAVLECAGPSEAAREAALSLVAPIMRYVDYAGSHAAQAYVEFQQHVVADADRERRDLLEQLLAGAAPGRGPLHAAAQAYGIGAQAPMMVVTGACVGGSRHTGEDAAAESGYATSAAVSSAGARGGRTLVVVRHGEIVAVPVLRTGMEPEDVCARFETVQRSLARDGTVLALGVSTVAHGVAELPRAYQEARSALDLVPPGGGMTALPRMSSFDYLALRADGIARQLVDPRITALLDEDDRRGGVLGRTVRAFADADMNLRVAAARLRVHHNTAHYRLRRIEERAGRNPRRIADLMELLVALALREAAGEDEDGQ